MVTVTKKTAYRQTAAVVRDGCHGRPLLVSLEPGALVLRLKQTRRELRLPWATLYVLVCRAEADAKRTSRRLGSRPVRRGVLS